ncbi:MAG TPA: hypothetical protein DHV36_09555 [Desulfobacteraceae bacterium]|nr:hypothetical protein [Desulfobacteraceae bacterium]|tara:strand:- start:1812 stop:2000 length:189 start_codon:yes stop_codon:yes gene_type:complete
MTVISPEDLRLLDKLTEAMGDSEGQTTDEIRQELREDGIDIDQVEATLERYRLELEARAKKE